MSEEKILAEIADVKRLIYQVLKEEERIEEEEQTIEAEERMIENQQAKLLGGLSALKFANIQAWKEMIWDVCDARVSHPGGKEIDYSCKLQEGGACRFEQCPKNQQ